MLKGGAKEGVIFFSCRPPQIMIRKLIRDGARIEQKKMFGLPYGFEPPCGILPRPGRRGREGRR